MRNRNRIGGAMAIALLLTLTLSNDPAMLGRARAQAAASGWQIISGLVPGDVTLNAVAPPYMYNPSPTPSGLGFLAVGNDGEGKGVIYSLGTTFWGAVWSGKLVQSFPAPLRAIAFISDGSIWVVGDAGLLLHQANSWQQVANPVANANLHTIQMFGNGEEGWAAGSVLDSANQQHPVLLHYQNGQWQQDNSITGLGDIASLHFATGSGWLVGSVGIWRYHDGGWSKESEPASCAGCITDLTAVRAISGDEAWAFGNRNGTCTSCPPYAIHRVGGNWQVVLPDAGISGTPPTSENYADYRLSDAYFTDTGFGWVVGSVTHSLTRTSVAQPSGVMLHYQNTRWSYDALPDNARIINSVYAMSPKEAIAVGANGLVLSYGLGNNTAPPPNPTTRVDDPHDANVTYFPQTGHTLRGAFRDYWQRHGGLAQFGYPLTEEFTDALPPDSQYRTVQYFERNRFEYHPENQPPYNVELGLLGREITQGRENETPFQRKPAMLNPASRYFTETGHNLTPPFLDYWERHGGLAVYGYPISEAFTEVSKSDGKSYTVQYFERNRFEYHPELPDPYKVSLGLLGTQILQAMTWMR